MGDITSLSTSIAWGVPVRPDLLGQSLEAYEKFLPTLTALRLCHRYGSGPEAHITRLPVEILSAVEELIFQDLQASCTTWLERFRHFESRCAPSDHFQGLAADVWPEFEDAAIDKLCDDCVSYVVRRECSKGCYKIVEDMVEEYIAEDTDFRFYGCTTERDLWEAMIKQGPKGNFNMFDELLREHFGLEAYFAVTRATEEHPKAWPSHPNHTWEFLDVLQTTTCYITLPRKLPKSASYPLSEVEADVGAAIIRGAQSSIVQIPSPETSVKRAKQFLHILRALRLKPYVHESQLLDRLTTNSDQESSTTRLDPETATATSEMDQTKADDMEKMEWPQLVVLVKAQFNWS